MKTRLLMPAALLILSGCAGLMAKSPPQFAGRSPLWVRPADVDAWVVPDEIGYAYPCQSNSHDDVDSTGAVYQFHCFPWKIRSRGEVLMLIVKPNPAARPCTLADPCPSPRVQHRRRQGRH